MKERRNRIHYMPRFHALMRLMTLPLLYLSVSCVLNKNNNSKDKAGDYLLFEQEKGGRKLFEYDRKRKKVSECVFEMDGEKVNVDDFGKIKFGGKYLQKRIEWQIDHDAKKIYVFVVSRTDDDGVSLNPWEITWYVFDLLNKRFESKRLLRLKGYHFFKDDNYLYYYLEGRDKNYLKRMDLITEREETLLDSMHFIHRKAVFENMLYVCFWKKDSSYETIQYDLDDMSMVPISNTDFFYSGKVKSIILPDPENGEIDILNIRTGAKLNIALDGINGTERYSQIDEKTLVYRGIENASKWGNFESSGNIYLVDIDNANKKIVMKTKFVTVVGDFLDSY